MLTLCISPELGHFCKCAVNDSTHVKSPTNLEEMFNVQQLLKECLHFLRQKSQIIFERTDAVITVFRPSLFNI